MTLYLLADLTFIPVDPEQNTDDGFDRFADAVQDQLMNLAAIDAGIVDPDLTVGIRDRWISFLIGIEADTQADAVRLLQANLRTALQAAGYGTPGWPTFKATTEKPEVRRAELAGT